MNKPENFVDIIAFFSGKGFFRKKSSEKQRELFDSLHEDFENEFDKKLTNSIFDLLLHYQNEKNERKISQEKAKLQKEFLPVSGGIDSINDIIIKYPEGKYLLLAAQNNTDIHRTALACFENFCKINNVTMLIGRLTYNKNSFSQPDLHNTNDLWYDKAIQKYLVDGHISLGEKFHFLADSNVIPTAEYPLSGFENATPNGLHVIIPATKLSMQVTASLKDSTGKHNNKIMYSTGAITQRNYIMRKAGKKAANSHNISAVYVDTLDENSIRAFEIMPNCDGFYDGHEFYRKYDSIIDNDAVEGYNFGDLHSERLSNEDLKRISNLLDYWKPKHVMVNDGLDFTSRNHHNIKDHSFRHLTHVNGQSVEDDIEAFKDVLFTIDKALRGKGTIHIIESNHDQALHKWLITSDFREDPINALTYLKLNTALYEHQKNTGNNDFNVLEYACKNIDPDLKPELFNNIIFHNVDDSVMVAGIENGCHGHLGSKGSKGSPKQFKKLGIPMNTGHTHTSSIFNDVYTAGIFAMDTNFGYNKGASDWTNTDIVTYKNGQRQIIFN